MRFNSNIILWLHCLAWLLITYTGTICDDLPELANGAITYTPPRGVSAALPDGQRYTGTIATHSCSLGYQLVGGSSSRACAANGVWNGTELSCQVPGTRYFPLI